MASPVDPLGALSELTGSLSAERFLAEYYEQKPWRLQGAGAADRFRHLISLEAIDALLARQVFRDSEISMARSEPKVTSGDFMLDGGIADRGAIARLFQEGATIILPQLHERVHALAEYCRGLEAVFSAHIQTNIYLTPADAQGFQTHYDNHCVFILQVEGTKRWRLYDSPVPVPFRGERFTPGKFAAGEPTQDFVLHPGDVLYVPRGLMHDAISEPGSPSLHITTGILVKTWADFILEAVSEASLHDASLRRGLPPGFHRDDFDRTILFDRFHKAIAATAKAADLDAVADLFTDNFLRSRQVDIPGALAGPAVTTDTRIRLRPRIQVRIADADERHFAVVAPGGDVLVDRTAEVALDLLTAGGTAGPADFAPLEESRAVDTMARLIAFGVAERVIG